LSATLDKIIALIYNTGLQELWSSNDKEEEMSNRTAELDALLNGVTANESSLDPFELAVVKGASALDTLEVALKSEFGLDLDQGAPDWLREWAAALTPAEIETIKTGRDREFAILHADILLLLGEDEERWTEAERAHAATARERLSAANLVLSCLKKATVLAA